MLYFFKFGNEYLLHTRTRLEKQDFKAFHGKKFSIIDIVSCIRNVEIVFETIKLYELREGKSATDDNDYDVKYYTPEPEMKYIYEYFYIFDKRCLELLKEYFGYKVYIYSKKEVKELRKKKVQTSLYSSIVFNEEDDYVNLILKKKNGNNTVKTPFIYLDYFILRLNDMLTVKNIEKSMYDREKGELYNRNERGIVETDDLSEFYKNQKIELVKREFKLTTKAFKYYRYDYNFGQFKTIYIDYKEKNGREIKRDKRFEREREKDRNEYFKEVFESIKQDKLEEKKAHERFTNREFKEPLNKWKNKSCCLNDLEKELDKLDYRIAYEYLRINTSPKIYNIFYYEHYEKGKHLDKIVMLAVKEAKKSEYIMNMVKEHERLRMPSLEKEVLYS